ncbi:PP2C family serine/threonine-protein phosphatase [Edaphovirga cremea]|uniref:PP2C family serine/threonine-protein phosphatase n=1 Tax=Edaphovirga cremea TaxID=2267246 RepID=UPI000DF01C20|nr:PP2C family serine/threonine-protein phosphatase [Edaphovirga cremea]
METKTARNITALKSLLQERNISIPDSTLTALCEDTEIDDLLQEVVNKIIIKTEKTTPAAEVNLSDPDDLQNVQEPPVDPEEIDASAGQNIAEENQQAIDDLAAKTESEETLLSAMAAPPLKPGQVPLEGSPVTTQVPEHRQPMAKINIANARVGIPFHSEIDIMLDNGTPATIQGVSLPEDIGIAFDPITSTLAGTPTKSGDIEMSVTWSCYPTISYTTAVLLIVNPDPRSLWKIIDPPTDDRYYKSNIDSKMIVDGGVRIAAASRRGRSHEHVGSFRDDDFFISHNAGNGWSVLLVADGAGSAKNSREGSRIVTKTVGDYLVKQLNGEHDLPIESLIDKWDSESQRAVGPFFGDLFHKAARLAVNKLNSEAIEANEPVKSYSTTLLATLSFRSGDDLFAASFWMGDGAIAAYGPAGRVRLLGTPDSGEYAGQTRFLDNDAVKDADFNKRIIIGKWKDISHLILMTDGVSDPLFETDNGLQSADKWDALITEISPCLSDDALAAERLTEWLNFFSPGNHDDRTIIISW